MRGSVVGLYRFPVKSLLGEEMEVVYASPHGFDGDRLYAVVEPETGFAVSAKKEPRLLNVYASLEGENLVMRFPDGRTCRGDDCGEALSKYLGRRVEIVRSRGTSLTYVGMGVDFSEGVRLYEKTGQTAEARFHDSMPLHLVKLESLQKIGLDEKDIPRFRPNIVYSSDADEQELVGGYIQAGDVLLRIVKPTKRCIVITHAQPGLQASIELLKNLRTNHQGVFGLYAEVVKPGWLAKNTPLKFYPAAGVQK
ncbi:MAG: MOSC N-terminal beta barrel domain-containing protein [Candidatus Caldarchaeum sp.]